MNISIGNNIKTARKKIGFTQDELAYQLGVTAQAVRAIEFGNWMLKVMDAFCEMPELITACRGFTRDCHMYLMSAHLKAGEYDECKVQFDRLKADMDRHYEFYQTVLGNEDEMVKYTEDALRYMQAYTKEFIEKKQVDIVNQLKGWHGENVDKVFGEK